MNEYYNKEMEKLEKMQKELHDRYSSEELEVDVNDYEHIINAKINISPKSSETGLDYVKKVRVYQEIARTKNWNTHVDNHKKVWYTHRMPGLMCFMCEDMEFIKVLIDVIEIMANKHPNDRF